MDSSREDVMRKFVLILLFCLISFGCLSRAPINTTAVETAVAVEMTQNVVTKPEIPTIPIIPTFPPPIAVTQKPLVQLTENPGPSPIPSLTIAVPTPVPSVITKSGNGDAILDIPEMEAGYRFIGLTNDGDAAFTVNSYDSAGNLDSVLVDTIGPYSGWHILPKDKLITKLDIISNGQWTVEIRPNIASSVKRITAPATFHGEGDTVLGVFCCTVHIPDVMDFVYPGDKTFSVYAYTIGGSKKLLVNDTGPYQGKLALPLHLEFLEIKASGGWDFSMTEKK